MHKLCMCILIIFLAVWSVGIYTYKLGIDRVTPRLVQKLLKTEKIYRVGVVTNQTGKNSLGQSTVTVLRDKGFTVTVIFVPEHGLDGNVPAGEHVASGRDAKTSVPVVSLYNKQYSGKEGRLRCIARYKEAFDILMFDLQDAGMRHYTYISTLYDILYSAAKLGKPVVVLDRPNPLGMRMEGPLVDPSLTSFISYVSIPVRYGMTMGELARYYNRYLLDNTVNVAVIQLNGYQRGQKISPWLAPLSPNIPTYISCLGYSFLGLMGELTPLDVGVGTSMPFQCIALPREQRISIQFWTELQRILQEFSIESMLLSYYSERKKIYYQGLKIAIPDINTCPSIRTIRALYSFFTTHGVVLHSSAMLDKALGICFEQLVGNARSYKDAVRKINSDLTNFFQKARSVFLYTPEPHIIYEHE